MKWKKSHRCILWSNFCFQSCWLDHFKSSQVQAEVAAEGRSLSLSLLLTRPHSLSHSFSNCGLGFGLSPFTFFDLERSLEKNEANFFSSLYFHLVSPSESQSTGLRFKSYNKYKNYNNYKNHYNYHFTTTYIDLCKLLKGCGGG